MEEEEEIVIAIVAVTAAEIGGGLAPATDPGTGTGSGEWKCRTSLSPLVHYPLAVCSSRSKSGGRRNRSTERRRRDRD